MTWHERVWAFFSAAGLLGLLVIGASLRPEPIGHGTHEQLGLPACGFYLATGKACPTCGMTTAFSHVANRDPWRGFVTQPFGAMLAVGASVGFWGSLHVAVFGSRLGRVAGRLLGGRFVWLAGVVWLASWVYTMLTWNE